MSDWGELQPWTGDCPPGQVVVGQTMSIPPSYICGDDAAPQKALPPSLSAPLDGAQDGAQDDTTPAPTVIHRIVQTIAPVAADESGPLGVSWIAWVVIAVLVGGLVRR